jgi:hypothetical protein
VLVTAPVVEIAEDVNALGVRCPEREADARSAVVFYRMGAEAVMQAEVAALPEEEDIEIRETAVVSACVSWHRSVRSMKRKHPD